MTQGDRLHLLPKKFDGSGNFDNWVSNFECISSINSWSEEEKALWFRTHMTGRTHVAYQCLSHEIRTSFNLVKAALRERFEPSSKQGYYRIKFEHRVKLNEEDWADVGDDLLSLANKAFLELSEQAREQVELLHYFNQLQSSPVYLEVKQR